MNRRSFLQTACAGALASGVGRLAGPAAAGEPPALPRAHWLENGLIDAGGSHEPLTFMLRVGSESRDAREQYERAQSEEVIRRLKEQGVEVFHTHLYKGFGMAAEKAEMEDARRTAALSHRYGLKVDSYIQWNTLMYETFFAEEPRAKDWVQRDADGRPILLTYGFEQSWRYRPCFANSNYLDYLKRIVRFAVEEVKTDFIHFDNFDLNPEPDSCHCDYCTRGFREYLRGKYQPALRRERFGFENLDYVNPPVWNVSNPPQKMEAIRDPVIQEWVAYRCHVMSESLRQMAEYARSMNSEVAIEVNPHGITGGNRAWEAGLDHAQFLKWTDAFWTEEPNHPGLEDDGRLITRIRSYKLARAFRNVLLAYVDADRVALAECLAFNQTIGFAGVDPLRAETLKFVRFYREHRELYHATQDDATVAVLRSYPSITYHNARAQLGAILVEQTLIQSRVPFRLIFDEHLADLSRYKVLILPDSECLSDNQIAAIRTFVSNGGGLVALGQAGLYDEWLRPRRVPGLSELLPGQKRGETYGEETRWRGVTGPTVRKDFGQGRAAYIPGAEFDGPLPAMPPYCAITNQFWKKPKNADQIVEAVAWAAQNALPVHISGPDYLVANLVSQRDQKRAILHLVNYNAKRVPVVSTVDVTLSAGTTHPSVTLLSPDTTGPQTLAAHSDSNGVHFQIPQVETYSVIVASWQ
ncbi:MAG TPA: alpha-amylase family protein [Bryobacteraceae bacterium]|nr:alpha-amylase family protein [Bryobacteraceae bacterium]